MPRKTRGAVDNMFDVAPASMRPRPDAAENFDQALPFSPEDMLQ